MTEHEDLRRVRPRAVRIAALGVVAVGAVLLIWALPTKPHSQATTSGSNPSSSLSPNRRSTPSTTGPTPSATTAVQAGGETTSTTAPTASVSTDPLGSQAISYLSSRSGTVVGAVYNVTTGRTWTIGAGPPQAEASIVKLNILEALLNLSGGDGLDTTEQSLSQSMIEVSDNDSATALWTAAGGTSGLRSFDDLVGLKETTPSTCVQCPGFPWPGWGLTTTTATDQIALLRLLVQPNPHLSSPERQYALRLMENVTPSERWGVSGGVPQGVTVALKNGWLPLNDSDTDWQVNSIGWVAGLDRNYLIAVLSTGNPTEQYGIDTIDELSLLTWNGMG